MPAVVAVAVALVGAFLLTSGGDGGNGSATTTTAVASGPGEIFLEPASAVGEHPFTQALNALPPPEDQAPTSTTAPADTTTTVAPGTPAITKTSGAAPGLYGGTGDQTLCDAAQLVSFLEANPDKAEAWKGALGVSGDIGDYVAGLTPLLLTADTRVTNHGFRDGRATPKQSVLQAGTAVLVDDRGVPRVRCACGNPLKEPVAVEKAAAYVGPGWRGFDKAKVAVVAPSPDPISTFTVADVRTGELIPQAAGSIAVVPSSTTAPTVAAIPEPNTDVTRLGTTSASSVFSGEFPVSLGVDGDATTSWFSKGPSGGVTTYEWVGQTDDLITLVVVHGNSQHSNPSFRRNFGFGAVKIQVTDEFDDVDFEQTVDLGGTPDPNVTVRPGVVGRKVKLTFTGSEDPGCGGFSELSVQATR